MDTFSTINDALKQSMRDGTSEVTLVLRTLVSDIKNVAIRDGRKDVTEADVTTALTKAIKTREDASEQYSKANRSDLYDVEQFQIAVLSKFLPKQLTSDEVSSIVNETIARLESQGVAKDRKMIGMAMRELAHLKGKADMKLVNQLISGLIS